MPKTGVSSIINESLARILNFDPYVNIHCMCNDMNFLPVLISNKNGYISAKKKVKTSAKTSVKTEGVKRLKTIQGSINMEENLRV